jgi:hypothetical protein
MKNLILFIALTFTSLHAIGQADNDNRLTPWHIGFKLGGNISKLDPNDTFIPNITPRNKMGIAISGLASYDLHRNVSLVTGINLTTRGYRLVNDTVGVDNKIKQTFASVQVPLGFSFRQHPSPSSSNFFSEEIGGVLNYSFRKGSETLYNSDKQQVRVIETGGNKFYPMVYGGLLMGRTSNKGKRTEYGVTYYHTFGTEINLKVSSGEFYNKSFPLQYNGSNLQFTFRYYFNTGNFQKSNEYFY